MYLAPNLREDQFYQLFQWLLGGHPGVEHGSDVLDIRLKGARWGAQVSEDVGDNVSQGWFAVVVLTVIIKSLVLSKKKNQRQIVWKGNASKCHKNPFFFK